MLVWVWDYDVFLVCLVVGSLCVCVLDFFEGVGARWCGRVVKAWDLPNKTTDKPLQEFHPSNPPPSPTHLSLHLGESNSIFYAKVPVWDNKVYPPKIEKFSICTELDEWNCECIDRIDVLIN